MTQRTLFGDRKNDVQLIKLKYLAMASSGFLAFESRIECWEYAFKDCIIFRYFQMYWNVSTGFLAFLES